MLDKFGGDSMDETRDNLERYRARIAPAARRAGRRRAARRARRRRTAAPHGLAGTDEAGSGGDD